MLEFLTDPDNLLQIALTVGAALFGAAVALVIYRWQRKTKQISFRVEAETALLSAGAEIPQDLEIRYRGRPVGQAHVIVVTVRNSGNAEIIASDYEEALSIRFYPGVRILSVRVSHCFPSSVNAAIERVEETNIFFNRFVFNPGDEFTVQVLVENYRGIAYVAGRVAGVKKIVLEASPEYLWAMSMLKRIFVVSMIVFNPIVLALGILDMHDFAWFVLFAATFVFSIVMFLIYRRMMKLFAARTGR